MGESRGRVVRVRVTESGATERVPNDGWNPDGWRQVTADMRAEGHRQGFGMKKGDE